MTTEHTSEGLGLALEDAAYECLTALSGVDTYDTNMRNHPQAWAAFEEFAAKVRAAERERCAKAAEDFLTKGRSPLGRSVADAIRRA